jgi:hypothetical protein
MSKEPTALVFGNSKAVGSTYEPEPLSMIPRAIPMAPPPSVSDDERRAAELKFEYEQHKIKTQEAYKNERINSMIQPTVKKPAALQFPTGGSSSANVVQPPRKVETTIAPLSFANVPSAPKRNDRRVVEPGDVFGTAITSYEQLAFDTIQKQHTAIYAAHVNEIRRQIMQLLPLKTTVVSDWGVNTASKFVTFSGAVTKLIHQITMADGNTTIDKALKAAQYKPQTGLFQKMLGKKPIELLGFKPHLTVLRANLTAWVTECSKLMAESRDHNAKLTVKMITLATAADISKPIADAVLDNAIANRRMLSQQLVQQSMLIDAQLAQMHGQLVNQMASVDQLLTVTIPAFENIDATR